MSRSSLSLATLAALMGAAGVALAALVTHAGGDERGRTAAMFLVLHAGALLGVAALSSVCEPAVATRVRWTGFALALGACLFSADLTSRTFFESRLFPMAAPTGGSLMILAWLALALVAGERAVRGPR